jgi:hypothetical protein
MSRAAASMKMSSIATPSLLTLGRSPTITFDHRRAAVDTAERWALVSVESA